MLSKDILENIKTLLAITDSINETYAKLKELEINNQKESKEYQSLIISLKSSLELEKSIYERFPKDLDILSNIDYTISSKEEFWINFNLQDNINAILNNHNLIKLRIHLNLFNRMLAIKDADFVISTNKEEVLENQSSRNILVINATIIRDFVNTLLIILNSYLNDSKYNAIKDLLLNFKYGLSFLYEDIEKDFLENDFNINNDLYWESNVVADYYRLDREKLNAIKRGTVFNIFREKTDNIIEIVINENSSKQEIFTYTISEILIRASLLLFGDKTVNFFNSQKLQLASNMPYNEELLKNLKNAQNRIDSIFAMYEKDKELLNIISLRVL